MLRVRLRSAVALALCASGWVAPLSAQGTWDAILAIDPFPSPYLSDWEINPAFGTLTVFNGTTTTQSVQLVSNVVYESSRLVAEGVSEPQLIPADAPTIFDSPFTIAGTTRHDPDFESQMRRTGRLSEGEYRACVAVVDLGGFQLAEACESFTIVYPDPPMLVAPVAGEVVTSQDLFFQWTPSQVPAGFDVQYVLEIAAVQPGQLPEEALRSNILHFYDPNAFGTQLQYPLDAQPLEDGTLYAWRVRALDSHGYPVASNGGSSEIWTFRYGADEEVTGTPGDVTLSLFNAYPASDDAPDDASDGTAPAPTDAPSSYGLTQICDNWSSPPTEFELGVNAPFGFAPLRTTNATLYRKDDPADPSGPHKWWLFGETERGRAVLLHGNCTGALSGLQWIASRKIGGSQRINEFLGTRTVNGPIESVEWGVFVVALQAGTVSADAGDLLGSSFLGGREIDVQRGLNVYMELNLREHRLWDVFQALGYDQKQITLTGFAGLDVSRAVGVGLGDGYEASVSQERTFLLLTAALPERTPIGPLARIAKSMQLSLEFEIKDSTGVNVTSAGESQTNYSREFIFRVKHTIDLSDDLFPRSDGSRALVGWLGADVAGEREQNTSDVYTRARQRASALIGKLNGVRGVGRVSRPVSGFFGVEDVACAPKPDLDWKVDFVINYGLEGKLYLGPLFFEDPALEVHIGPVAASGQRDLSIAFASHLGVEGYEQRGILGISRVREGEDNASSDDPACRPMRPRSNAVSGPTPPTVEGVDPEEGGSPAGSPHSAWKWNWKVAWDVAPLGMFSKAVGGGLWLLFAGLGLGGI